MSASTTPLFRRPRSWGVRVQRLRHLIQLGFAAFIAYVAAQHLVTGEGGSAAAASPEAYCPLGGFESFYQWATTAGRFVPHTHASNLVLAAAIVLTAIVGRSFFCGWICPLGALQEAVAAFSHRLQRRFPRVRRVVQWVGHAAAPYAPFLDRWLRYLKYLVLVWLLTGTAIYGVLVFRNVDPWIALLTITSFDVVGGLIVLGIVLAASFFVERPWCRYACPLGAVIGVVGRVSPLKIERDADACLACNICTRECPMGIPVATLTRVSSPECITCLECVGACPSEGGLDLKLALPGLKPKAPRELRPILDLTATGGLRTEGGSR